MKSIQVLIDEPLLKRLDDHADVRAYGRSAVLRRAAAEYLRRHRSRQITEQYKRAYGRFKGLDDFGGWGDEGAWPER